MVLLVKEDWLQFLTAAGIPGDSAVNYVDPAYAAAFLFGLRISALSNELWIPEFQYYSMRAAVGRGFD